jgi:hypothetical protein
MKGTSSGLCTLYLRGLDIKNVEPGIMGLGRSDPFFEVSRKNADHAAGVVRWYVSSFSACFKIALFNLALRPTYLFKKYFLSPIIESL